MASRPREKGLVQTEVTPTIVAGVCDPGIPTATGLTEAGYNACPIVARAEAPGCYPKTSVFEPCREKRQKAPESATPGEPNLEPQTQSHHCFALTLASFRAMCPDGNSFPNVHTLLSASEGTGRTSSRRTIPQSKYVVTSPNSHYNHCFFLQECGRRGFLD